MTRRRNGEGSISKRPDGRGYQVRRRYTDPITGAKKRISLYGKTEAEVRAKLAALNERLSEGAPARDSRATLGSWLVRWRTVILPASDRALSSVTAYSSLSRNHLESCDIRLDRLRPSDIDALLHTVKRKGLSQQTIRSVWKVLRIALDAAVRDGLIASNPAQRVEAPRIEHRDVTALTPSQVAQIVAEARTSDDGRYYAITLLIAHTGLRAGEACALRARDITADSVRVVHTLTQDENGDLVPTPTKTPRSKRTVPIPPEVAAVLTARKRFGLEYMFTTALGEPIDPGSYGKALKRIAASINLPATPHSLRHAFATHLIESGVSPRTVADLLGHTTTATTLSKYTHPTPDHHRAAITSYAEGLKGGSTSSPQILPDVR